MRQRPARKECILFLLRGVLFCTFSLAYLFTAGAESLPHTNKAPKVSATPITTCKRTAFQTGVVYPQWSPQGYGAGDKSWLTQIAAIRQQTAACWLEMPILFFQDTSSSTDIKPGVSTPTVASFTYGVHAAHALGFHVFVTPLINARRGPHWWAGSIHFDTYEEEQQWFASYWQTFKPYVTAAVQAGVEQLAIGTEEEWLQNNAPDSLWNDLIANIRSVFSGTLSYDTNWTTLQTPPPAWMHNADLKMIGVSGYLSLVDTPIRIDPEQIPALWKERAQPLLDNFAATLDKPIFLSEVGYRNTADTLYKAWQSKSAAPADPEEQAAACDAVVVNSMADPHILGTFFWGWDKVGGYSLKGSPAVTALYKRYSLLQDGRPQGSISFS